MEGLGFKQIPFAAHKHTSIIYQLPSDQGKVYFFFDSFCDVNEKGRTKLQLRKSKH